MRLVALILAVACSLSPLRSQSTSSLDSLYLKSTHYRHVTGMWRLYKPVRADAVMLGNSITAGAEWSELLGRPFVINRGIGGDNLVGFLHRLEFVVPLRPKLCLVMGGINDLYAGYTPEQVALNYAALLDSLQAASIIPVVQSTLHVAPPWRHVEENNLKVARLNDLLREICRRRGIEFLDLNAGLSDGGRLRAEYTTDGVHLTPAAYSVWARRLEPLLNRHGL